MPIHDKTENPSTTSLWELVASNEILLRGKNLPFFLNGLFAEEGDRFGFDCNYTCAVDSVMALVEAILMSKNYNEEDTNISNSVISEVKMILQYRLENNYSWHHSLRNQLWSKLASQFPGSFKPLGRVDAHVEEPLQDIGKLWPIEVVCSPVCSCCEQILGDFSCVFDYIPIISSPKRGPLLHKAYSLFELVLYRIGSYVRGILQKKLRCFTCGGSAKLETIPIEDIKLPSFVFLNLFLDDTKFINTFCDSCELEDNVKIGNYSLEFVSALLAQNLHVPYPRFADIFIKV